MLSYFKQYGRLISRYLKRCLFVSCFIFLTNACHIVSPTELLNIEAEGDVSKDKQPMRNWESNEDSCTLSHLNQNAQRSTFVAWWEGEWTLDQKRLSQHLAQAMGSQKDSEELMLISTSLSSAFHLKIKAQQAQLFVDGEKYRLATTPVRTGQGVRLIGGQRDMTILCKKNQILWRVESGESFPLRFVK